MTVNACGPRSATPGVDLTLHLTTMIRIRLPRGEWSFDESRPLGRPGGFGDVFERQDSSGQPNRASSR